MGTITTNLFTEIRKKITIFVRLKKGSIIIQDVQTGIFLNSVVVDTHLRHFIETLHMGESFQE